jgi:holo-[acyl-carrier protein] synthase
LFRFAAKEAVIKASEDRLTFHDILILKKKSGAPFAIIKAGNGRSQDREALLSISHDGEYATAVCIMASEEAWPAEAKAATAEAGSGGAVSEGRADDAQR